MREVFETPFNLTKIAYEKSQKRSCSPCYFQLKLLFRMLLSKDGPMPNTGILFAGIEAIRKGPMKDEYQTAGELKFM